VPPFLKRFFLLAEEPFEKGEEATSRVGFLLLLRVLHLMLLLLLLLLLMREL